MSSRLRLSALAVITVAVLPVLSACDTSPGSAALVGGHRITIGQLQSAVNDALADANVHAALYPAGGASNQYQAALGGNRTGFIRLTLARLISERVVSAVAAAHHVTVTPAQLQKQTNVFVQQAGSLAALQQSAADQVGVGKDQLSSLIRFSVLQQNLGTALTADLKASKTQLDEQYQKDIDNYDQFDVAQIVVKSKSEAESILKQVKANPASFASLAKKDSIDAATASKGGEAGLVGRSEVLAILSPKDRRAPVGSYVIGSTSGDFVVIHIESRKTTPESAVTAQLTTEIFSTQSQQLLSNAVTAEAKKLNITVSPRYGRWNPASETVVGLTNPAIAG